MRQRAEDIKNLQNKLPSNVIARRSPRRNFFGNDKEAVKGGVNPLLVEANMSTS